MKLTQEEIGMLNALKQSYIKQANNIKGWRKIGKSRLANLYLAHEHIEPERSYYFSALMCKYWNSVIRYYNTSQGLKLDVDDFAMWLAEAFFVAFKYRRWTDPTHKLYNDPNGPDKVITRSIFSTRMRYYQASNMDKRKLNYQTDSIERQLDSFGTMADAYKFLGVEGILEEGQQCKDVVNHLLKEGSIFEAIIVELICFNDTFTERKIVEKVEYVEDMTANDDDEYEEDKTNDEIKYETRIKYIEDFSLRKLMAAIRKIDTSYEEYFNDTYTIDPAVLSSTINKIRRLDKDKLLLNVVKDIIDTLSENEDIRGLIC